MRDHILFHLSPWNCKFSVCKCCMRKKKKELEYSYREPQIILQRATCGSRAADWPPLLYSIQISNCHFQVVDELLFLCIILYAAISYCQNKSSQTNPYQQKHDIL